MISHKYKCIFIHIPKCAGTSIEHAFGVDVKNYNAEGNEYLFGWDDINKLWVQHATPQQLFDLNYISEDIWRTYYKFIVFRNSWDRAYSDYLWMDKLMKVRDTFFKFLNKEGTYRKILTDNSSKEYAGSHLELQKSYFFLNNKKIFYDTVIDFENLQDGLNKVIRDLNLNDNFFSIHLNRSIKKKGSHYSKFYNYRRKRLVLQKYKEDIDFFNFKFEDKKRLFENLKGYFKY